MTPLSGIPTPVAQWATPKIVAAELANHFCWPCSTVALHVFSHSQSCRVIRTCRPPRRAGGARHQGRLAGVAAVSAEALSGGSKSECSPRARAARAVCGHGRPVHSCRVGGRRRAAATAWRPPRGGASACRRGGGSGGAGRLGGRGGRAAQAAAPRGAHHGWERALGECEGAGCACGPRGGRQRAEDNGACCTRRVLCLVGVGRPLARACVRACVAPPRGGGRTGRAAACLARRRDPFSPRTGARA